MQYLLATLSAIRPDPSTMMTGNFRRTPSCTIFTQLVCERVQNYSPKLFSRCFHHHLPQSEQVEFQSRSTLPLQSPNENYRITLVKHLNNSISLFHRISCPKAGFGPFTSMKCEWLGLSRTGAISSFFPTVIFSSFGFIVYSYNRSY